MPKTEVIIYQEKDGDVPLLDWLDHAPTKLQDKCYERIERLLEQGYDLRRPIADILEDGIYELRAKYNRVHYRILYAFVGKNIALLSHCCTKIKEVPKKEINRAKKNRDKYLQSPEEHTYLGEI